MNISFDNTREADVLVVGGGLAGLRAALSAAQTGARVLLAVRGQLCSGASFYPHMDTLGCQCPTEDEMDRDRFLEEIRDSSQGMHDDAMCRYYIEHVRQRVAELPQLGITPQKLEEPKLACFARRPRDIYIWGGWDSIRDRTRVILENHPRIRLLEHTSVWCLLVEGGNIRGAVLRRSDGTLELAAAGAVVLATGGYGDLYLHNLNPPDVGGDGHVLALQAGARLINLEFQQFIPGFLSPLYKTILREGTLDHCTGLTDARGQDVLRRLLPDDQSYRECLKLRATHGPFTSAGPSRYFDIALMQGAVHAGDTQGVRIHYSPSLLEDGRQPVRMHIDWLRREFGLDILETPIRIAPFFHAANGGIRVDSRCQTAVTGLFAAGEAAGGIHGADRHGGNATGSCLVFGHLAGKTAGEYALGQARSALSPQLALEQMTAAYPAGPDAPTDPQAVCDQVRRLMWLHGNVVRTESGLTGAKAAISRLRQTFFPGAYLQTAQAEQAVRAHHLLLLGEAVLSAMLLRRESRGSHYRADYPRPDQELCKRIVVSMGEGNTGLRVKLAAGE